MISVDVDSDDYSLVEALWEGSCIHTKRSPHDLIDKCNFYSGAWAVLLALKTCVDAEDYDPQEALHGMLLDCRRFFDETDGDLKDSEAAEAQGRLA